MDREQLAALLSALARGETTVDAVFARLRILPYEDLGFAKLDHHRAFLAGRVAAKNDITMSELASDLETAAGAKADPASLSRWLIRNGYRFKKNSAGERARSPRHQSGARGLDRHTPAAHAA